MYDKASDPKHFHRCETSKWVTAKISNSDRLGRVRIPVVFLLSLLVWVSGGLPAQAFVAEPGPHQARNFDARVDYNLTFAAAPRRGQLEAIQGLRDVAPGLAVTYDRTTGATRTLLSRDGYLTAERPTADAMTIAQEFVTAYYEHLGLTPADLADYEVTDEVTSAATGATHIYLRQVYLGLPVYNGQLHINVNRDGRIMSVNNTCMPDIAAAADSNIPELSAGGAVAAAANHLGIQLDRLPEVISTDMSPAGVTRVRGDDISRTNIEARLMWLPIRSGEARLVWNFQVATLDDRHVYDFTVDAFSGEVWTRFDWVANDSYGVFPAPVESPNHSPALPPADDRQIVLDPADPVASPFGWHDTNGFPGAEFTVHQGNNVHAYDDANDIGGGICTSTPSPPAVEPDCGGLLDCNFDFPIDFATQDPLTYTSGAVTNLFYWNNLIHDVQYQYGFDEAGGNFQENSYGGGGLAADYVLAEAQDGSGINNANFCTPPDGFRPRMQMFLWNLTTPRRDGAFDNGIILHEYGHGISNRLVGGPSNVSCLGNLQQPGEGLSDWWSLVYTAELGDLGTDARGIGTYALGQPTSGPGVRTQRYSTDPAINTHTYESISGKVIPHGVGEVWAQAAWEVYWALVDAHGFDPDLKNALGGSGNQRAMLYVNEGLKNTICSPTFVDVRDGILQAAASPPFNGQDVCLLWEAFAAFGLGEDAVSGGPNSTAPTNGFAVPAICLGGPTVSVAASDPTATEAGPTSGAFTVTRVGDTSAALAVRYSVGGTATPGSDYAALLGTVSLAAGQTIATIAVVPNDDTEVEGDETVVMTLVADPAYDIGVPAAATVTIVSDDQPAGIPLAVDRASWRADKLLLEVRGQGAPGSAMVVVRNQDDAIIAAVPAGADGTWRLRIEPFTIMPVPCFVKAGTGSAAGDPTPVTDAPGCGGPPPPPTDTTPPEVSLTSPADGSTLGGTVTLTAAAMDGPGGSGVSEVRFFLVGVATPLGVDTTAPYTATWATTTAANGPHVLRVEAEDGAGNIGVSADVNVTVDNGPPPETEITIVLSGVPPLLQRGDLFTVTALVSNIGATTASGLTVTVGWTGRTAKAKNPRDTSQALADLEPNASTTVPWLLKADREGPTTITMTISRAGIDLAEDSQPTTIQK